MYENRGMSALISLKRPPFFWLALLLGIGLAGFYFGSARIIYRYRPGEINVGWTSEQRNGEWVITKVESDGPAAGKIEPGDRLLAFNGDQRAVRIGAEIY